MKINFNTIPPEGQSIEAQEPAEMLKVKKGDIVFPEPINIEIKVNRVGDNLLINGKLTTSAEMTCSRCLKRYRQPLVNKNFSIVRYVSGDPEVDITGDIREEILVQIPIKPLCREKCKGICPKCGKDFNEGKCSCDLSQENINWSELDKLKL